MPETVNIIYKLYLLEEYFNNNNNNNNNNNSSSKLAPLVPELTSHWTVLKNSFISNS